MIYIQEKQTEKVPGLTSLFITFDFKKEIVNVLKTCTPCNYNKKTNIWEIPLTRLSKFINQAYKYDNIDLKLIEDTNSNPIKYTEQDLGAYKTTPYQYQKEGILYGLNHKGWLLLDQPGLGKTLQMICLAQELKEKEGVEHCLIICGINTLKSNWEKEIIKHSDLSCRVLGKRINKKGNITYASVADRIEELSSTIDEFFVILNIETLRSNDVVKQLKSGKNKFDMIVVDEIHTCFVGSTQVIVDDEVHTIEEVVEKNIGTYILSHDFNTGIDEYKLIEDKYRYDYCGRIVTLRIQSEDGKEIELKVTPDHLIFTHNRGYVKAIDITEEDILEVNCI